MRTTLTIDDDVAAKLKRLAKGSRYKDVVNRALRLGLQQIESSTKSTPHYRTEPVSGKPRQMNLDNVAELLAESEGDSWR